MNNRKYSDKAMIAFFTIVIVASLIVETMIILGSAGVLYFALMWIPAVAAAVATLINSNREGGILKSLGIRRCKIKYILLSVIIPLIYLLIPYAIYWILHPHYFAYSGVAILLVLSDVLPVLILGVFMNIASAIGEEIGWRGFMFPGLLERFSLKKTLLITGLFWAGWHLPILIAGNYMSSTALWYRVPAFLLCILPVGIISGLLTYNSKSIWPATFLHAAHNNFDQAVFDVITIGANKMYYVSETGVLTIICVWIIAIAMYRNTIKNKKETIV